MPDVVCIVNPVAGRGRTVAALPRVERLMKKEGIDYEIVKTEEAGQATLLAKNAADKGARVVAAMGGDGTVSEVAAGLVRSKSALALIPTGTGNDFARAIGLLGKVPLAVRTLKDGSTRLIDVGRAGHLIFVNSLGVGFDGEVTHQNQRVKKIKGLLSYLFTVLKLVPTYQNPTFHLQGRDWEFKGKGVMVEIGNGRYAGGGFQLCPKADMRDGLLDITFVGDYGLARRLPILSMVLFRQVEMLQDCRFFKSDILRVAVNRPTYIHADGNLHHVREPFTIEVLPAALNVLFPQN
ncbi:MAG: diacylglycerol kinase family lipid kinase [Acidobacteria bacterium]|nr:diacylglycerol kinase family lipid kinase [Acidobacteriota bacterium]